MLKSVKISNIALIEDVEISLNKGLNIISGETGAGKSIILNSLNLILGEQAKLDLIRSGKENAKIQAIFDISADDELKSFLKENIGIDTDEDLLIIDREISLDKGSGAFINNQRVLVQTLKAIGKYLIDMHGQHQNQSLFDKNQHLKLLDRYAGLDEDIKLYRREFQNAIILNKELKLKIQLEEEKEKVFQFSTYALEEIQKADLKSGEEDELNERLKRLNNAHDIKDSLEQCFTLLYKSENSVITNLQRIQSLLERHQENEREIKKVIPFLNDSILKLEPVTDFLNSQKDSVEYSPQEIEKITRRLDEINHIKKKYGPSFEDVIAYEKKLQDDVSLMGRNKEDIEQLEEKINVIIEKLGDLALRISEKRRSSASLLKESIEEELAFLGMGKAKFQVEFSFLEDENGKVELPDGKKVRLSKDGIEKIEFLISSNLGEDFKPLAKVASGGEISRIMLSVKNILRKIDPILTLVFDEVDAGIGGETAFAVGKKLKEIAKDKQIICITHLAQIASMGLYQYKVEKFEEQGRTKTIIRSLSHDERIKEISRMLSGEQLSDLSLEHARAFLEQNSKIED